MPTYCVPVLSSVPGSPAGDFPWWTTTPAPTGSMRYFPDNPNWLGAFSLSTGAGASNHSQFRALRDASNLYLSWVVRASSLSTVVDRVNILLGDGTNYVALQVRVASAATTPSPKDQNSGWFTYRLQNCTVSGSGAITPVAPDLAIDGANLETTGRMWVDVTTPRRLLQTRWAFQVAIPLGAAWSPSPLNLPTAGAFKLWFEVWAALPGGTTAHRVPNSTLQTSNILQIIPPGLNTSHMLDMSTGTAGCDAAVSINWGGIGVRNVAAGDPPRPGTTSIRLDLGQNYPPNLAAGPTPSLYNESHTPNVAASQFQNQIYAQPTFPGGALPANENVRGRFSLANWGSQIAIPTANSWRPIPGGEDVGYLNANSEMRFVWPLPTADPAASNYVNTLVRNINRYLNATGRGLTIPSGAQSPHQCMLVELFSTNPNVVFSRSSLYQNMDVARASVFRRLAEISVVGLSPISPQPRDVYLYLQTFNMPDEVTDEDRRRLPDLNRALSSMAFDDQAYFRRQISMMDYQVEDIAAQVPTYIVHAYHDTGQVMELENGQTVPILSPQTSFGYFMLHEGDLQGWETRIYGAEKITDDFYRVRVPNNGSVYVETAVQARQTVNEQPLPPDGITGGCEALAARFESQGALGRVLAVIVRFICRLFGG